MTTTASTWDWDNGVHTCQYKATRLASSAQRESHVGTPGMEYEKLFNSSLKIVANIHARADEALRWHAGDRLFRLDVDLGSSVMTIDSILVHR